AESLVNALVNSRRPGPVHFQRKHSKKTEQHETEQNPEREVQTQPFVSGESARPETANGLATHRNWAPEEARSGNVQHGLPSAFFPYESDGLLVPIRLVGRVVNRGLVAFDRDVFGGRAHHHPVALVDLSVRDAEITLAIQSLADLNGRRAPLPGLLGLILFIQ